MARDRKDVVSYTGHVAPDIFASIVYAGVAKGEEGGFDELAGAEGHEPGVLGRNSELHVVEKVEVFQKRPRVRKHLSDGMSFDP